MAVKKKKAAKKKVTKKKVAKKKKAAVTKAIPAKRGRKPFAVTEENMDEVARYLERKVAREHMSDDRGDDYNMAAIIAFRSPKDITKWCEINVTGNDWTKLVRAIQKTEERSRRTKRRRTHGERNSKHTITLHWEALEFLQIIKKEYDRHHSRDSDVETLSDAVFFLNALYEKSKKAKVKMPSRAEWEYYVMRR